MTPSTLPPDFFDKKNQQAPATLPPDFFDKKKAAPEEKTALGFAGNVFSSAGNLAVNIAKLGLGAIEKPVRNVGELITGRSIAKAPEEEMVDSAIAAPAGMLEKFAGRPIAEAITGRKMAPTPEEKAADAAIAGMKQRYGGWQNIKDTAYSDPVGLAMDASMLAGGASGALRGASNLARGAELGRTAEALGRGAEIAKTVATKTNPIIGAGKAVQATREAAPVIKTAIEDRLFPGDPHQMAIQAIKPRASRLNFAETLKTAMPDIKAAETKPIASVQDALEATKAAKQANRAAYDAFRGPQSAMGTVVDMSPVADSMEASIPHDLAFEASQSVPDAIAAVEAIKNRASAYRTKIPLAEAERQLQAANARLDEFYAKYPRQQWKSLATNPETASIYSKAEALRNAIYNSLDEPNAGAGARELQSRYGKLLEVEQELQRRQNVADRQQPQSLAQQVGKAQAIGKLAMAGGKAVMGDRVGALSSALEGMGVKAASDWLKEQQATNALLARAFRNYKTPQSAYPTPAPVNIRGLLESGPIPMPPVADPSGVTAYPSPPPFRTGFPANAPKQLPAASSQIGVSGTIVPDIIGRSSRGSGSPRALLPPPESEFRVINGKELRVPKPQGVIQREDAPLLLPGSPDPFRPPVTLPGEAPFNPTGEGPQFPMSRKPEQVIKPRTSESPMRQTPEEDADFIKKFLIPEKKPRKGAKLSALTADPLGLFGEGELRV